MDNNLLSETMTFSLKKSLEILERTPVVLSAMLNGIDQDWTSNNEGENSWSPFDIVGHLIHGEKTDWVPRIKIVLSNEENKTFEPFDRFAQMISSKGKSMNMLLDEFTVLRKENIRFLKSKSYDEQILDRTGIHPHLGTVTLRQLLSAWVVHDLSHIAQIGRVMAKQYKTEVGPWSEYLSILDQ